MVSASAEFWLRWQPPDPAKAGAVINNRAQRTVERRSIVGPAKIEIVANQVLDSRASACAQKKRPDDSSLAARLVLIVPAENAGARVCAGRHRMTRDPKARLLLIGFELTTAAQCEGHRVQPCFVFNGFQTRAGLRSLTTSTCWKPEPKQRSGLRSMLLPFGWSAVSSQICSFCAGMG